jgi:hypothetical protein
MERPWCFALAFAIDGNSHHRVEVFPGRCESCGCARILRQSRCLQKRVFGQAHCFCPMNAGDCFWGDPNGGHNEHPWVILNDPTQHGGKALLLNFSTVGDRPVRYSVPAGYHVFISTQSAICYGDMIVRPAIWVAGEILRGAFKPVAPMAAPKLQFLSDQAKTVGFVSRELLRLL